MAKAGSIPAFNYVPIADKQNRLRINTFECWQKMFVDSATIPFS